MSSSARSLLVLASFIIVLLITIFGTIYKNTFIETVLKRHTEEQLEIISNTYIRTVWDRYYPVINFIITQPKSEWELYIQYTTFKYESTLALSGHNIISANVYNHAGDPLLKTSKESPSTNQTGWIDSLISGNKDLNIQDVIKQNQTESTVLASTAVKQGTSSIEKIIVRTLVPLSVSLAKRLIDKDADKAVGVLEVYYDVTTIAQTIYKAFNYLLIISGTVLIILITLIYVASKKAEDFIEKQQEASMEMAAAKASAEAESRSKSQFLANVTHELRTPLNAIIGFSELISSESMGPINNIQYKEFIKDINTSGVHLLSLINDILDFSKAEVNKLEVTLEQIDLTKVAKLCLRMVSPRAEEAKVKLVEDMPQEHIVLMLDQKRIKQIILNILSNAVKFTPENGQISLKIWKDTKVHIAGIEIRDSGVGMAPQDLAKALSPFGQVDNKLSRKYEGTGLGLPLTKKLVELMKGKFEIKSETGIGTTVTIIFPLALAAEPTPTASS